MKLPFLRKVIPLFLVFPTMLQPALAWENNWGNGYNGGWNNQDYYYQQLESIEYNGRIIRTGIRPNSDICSLVRQILGHCDGFIIFDKNTRTHIFRNYSHQQYYQNNQWGNRQYYRERRDSVPTWPRRGGCVYQDKNIRILCD